MIRKTKDLEAENEQLETTANPLARISSDRTR